MGLFSSKRHFPIEAVGPPPGQPGLHWVDIVCVVFFVLCAGAWLVCIPTVAKDFTTISEGRADGFGMGVFGVFVVGVSLPPLVISFVLSVLASRLPLWFRILSVFPGLAGVLAGIGIIVALRLAGVK